MTFGKFGMIASIAVAVGAGPTGVFAPSLHAQPARTALPAGTVTPQTPESKARATGHRVLVPALATETGDTYANPDGTYTLEQHSLPFRVRRGAAWVPLDLTLKRSASGSVSPAAVPTQLDFSGGGSAPLVQFGGAGKRITLSWPGTLPAPALSGNSATYRDVLPGVDLKLQAQADGFAEVLVVKTRAAAVNPALASLRFGLAADGLTVRATPSQGLVAADRAGHTVFDSSAPQMWDAGARTAVGSVAVSPGSLAVVPDRALLTDPATKFPVSIDPDFHAGLNGWAEVYAQHPDQSYWGGDGDGVAKVGYAYDYTVTVRSYFQFDVSPMVGKHVLSAEFNDLETYAPSCSARRVGLYETAVFNGGMTWNHQPNVVRQLNDWNVAYGYNSNCQATNLGTDATVVVNDAIGSGTNLAAFMWKADDEGDHLAWKKFSTGPTLIVHYNSYPSAPGGQSAGYSGHPGEWGCGNVPNQPYIATATPDLYATATDPDGGNIALHFQWYNHGGALVGETTTQMQASGTPFDVPIPAGAFSDGSTIAWQVQAYDGIDWGPWSAWCDLTVDKTAPSAAPTVTSTVYPACNAGVVCTGAPVGTTGAFTFSANGVADVAGYRYGETDPPASYAAAAQVGGSATAGFTPPKDGPQDLYVQSVDRAGNLGPILKYHFFVGIGTPPVARWPLDGYGMAAAAPDVVDGGHDGTVNTPVGNAHWTAGREDDAIQLDGNSGYVSTAGGPVVGTTGSFSISAWVKLDSVDNVWHTAVSQDGNRESGFFLQYLGDVHEWAFTMPEADADNAVPDRATSSAAAVQAGVWTHLIGTYDPGSGKLQLYVNGKLAGTATHTAAINATGAFDIGRAKYDGGPVDYWPGAIDEVRAYNRVVSAAEAHDLATAPTAEQASYPLDEASGTTTADLSGNYRTATLVGGVTRVPGVVGNGAAQFDGSTGEIDPGVPAVRTDNSFTVTAQVKLDATKNAQQIAVSQDGPQSSGFVLGYRASTNKWTFAVSTADAAAPALAQADSTSTPQTGTWTALAGVYDAASGQVRIYVNGALESTQPATINANVAGNLVLGRAKQGGNPASFWGGAIDDVHVYTGARTENQIDDEYLNPVTSPIDYYPNQLTRYAGEYAAHFVTSGPIPAGFHIEGSLGWLLPGGYAPAGAPATATLYSCHYNGGQFVSLDPGCEGNQYLATIGNLYASAPSGVPSKPVYRCMIPSNGDHFVSNQSDCEGTTNEGLLGYTLGYAVLERYTGPGGWHWTTATAIPAGFYPEGPFGLVVNPGQPGTVPIYSCLNGSDQFTSTASDCGGAKVIEEIGAVWTVPPASDGHQYAPLYNCTVTATGSHFDSLDPRCEGQTPMRLLGYVLSGW